MNRWGCIGIGVGAWMLAATSGAAPAQSAPATDRAPAPTSTTASAPTAPATRPTVAELLTHKTAPFNFDDVAIPAIIDFISKTYDIEIFCASTYELKGLVTMKFDNVTARQAINSLNSTLLTLGYTLVESVRGDPPRVVVTVVPTRADAGTFISTYYGSNPDLIPEGDAMRTQIMTFSAADPEQVRTLISAVIGRQAEMSVNASTMTVTLTDTGSHVRAAAALLQTLDKQAGGHP
jgi:type II secretory pathway component GspD/PulD (secretin)